MTDVRKSDAQLSPEQRHKQGGYDETLFFACRGYGHHHDCTVCDDYEAQHPTPGKWCPA